MCGIFGYSGNKQAQGLVLQGLKHLEYRGYDSSGIAIQTPAQSIHIEKTHGKIKNLEEALKKHPLVGTTAIGHTRWATHGVPTQENAHPHLDEADELAVVHNGIIENYFDLKKTLQGEGVRFRSETDTEVIVHLVAKYYKGNLEDAVRRTLRDLKGTYAIAVIASREPGKIVAAKRDSPLVIASTKNESYLASDISALLEHTNQVTFIENGDVVTLHQGVFSISDVAGKPITRRATQINWDIAQAKKGGYPHYMLKEIFEQPGILTAILKERIEGSKIHFDELKIKPEKFKKIKRIFIVACGTAYHAGLTAKYILEDLAKISVAVDTSSEFRYRDPKIGKDTLVIVISQSGETADTLAALREAKSKGALTLAVCNVLASSIAREAQGVIYTHAGPEIAVASTKAFTAQVAILSLLSFYLGSLFKTIAPKKEKELLKELLLVPHRIQKILDGFKNKEASWKKNVHDFNVHYHEKLEKYFHAKGHERKRSPNGLFLYLGRNINYPIALEGALKLKEIAYIPAEGYPAGEMKHGPIALIDENPWVICLAPESNTYDKMISNIQEIRARGGRVIPIVTEGDEEIKRLNPVFVIEVPKTLEIFSPLLTVIPLQIFAYLVALEFGEDIDQPRNLAKSVTVE